MPKIRTTIRPDQELDVDEHEESQLRALGVVLDTDADAEQGGDSDDEKG